MSTEGVLNIVGMDPERPPQIQPRPCIDLFFALDHEAPEEWCEEFHTLATKARRTTKIASPENLFVETWVSTTAEIQKTFDELLTIVEDSNAAYAAKQEAKRIFIDPEEPQAVALTPEQIALNEIIRGLTFAAVEPE